jgi:hypothetical protein
MWKGTRCHGHISECGSREEGGRANGETKSEMEIKGRKTEETRRNVKRGTGGERSRRTREPDWCHRSLLELVLDRKSELVCDVVEREAHRRVLLPH